MPTRDKHPNRAAVVVHPRRAQAGIVLPVALFALFAATILTLAFVKATTISLRVGGASVVAAETQAAAELQLSNFFRLNPTDPDAGGWSQPGTTCGTVVGSSFDCTAVASLPPGVVAEIHNNNIEYLDCGIPSRDSSPSQYGMDYNYYRVPSSADNSSYGSHAEVAAGVGKLRVVPCPKKE